MPNKTVRYIKPETICIGDTIRVTRKKGDLQISTVGTVATREHYGRSTISYTPAGQELCEYIAGTKPPYTVALLNRNQTPNYLEGIDF